MAEGLAEEVGVVEGRVLEHTTEMPVDTPTLEGDVEKDILPKKEEVAKENTKREGEGAIKPTETITAEQVGVVEEKVLEHITEMPVDTPTPEGDAKKDTLPEKEEVAQENTKGEGEGAIKPTETIIAEQVEVVEEKVLEHITEMPVDTPTPEGDVKKDTLPEKEEVAQENIKREGEGDIKPTETITETEIVTETHKKGGTVIGGVHFAPVTDLPWQRRVQTLAAFCSTVIFLIPFALFLFYFCIVKTYLWAFTIPYVYHYLTDRAPSHGGRRVDYVRRLTWWCFLRDYFPAQLIRDEECVLRSDKNYVLGYHPHGIFSMGVLTNFMTEATGVSELFPETTFHVATLSENFRVPLLRELLLAMGAVSVSKKSLQYVLNNGKGQSVVIVVGGAAEALDTKPKTNNLTLAKRHGFVKLALQNGAGLVPVFGFNENDLFRMPLGSEPNTFLRKGQEKMLKMMGFSLPVFHGRGFFQYNFGCIPVRKPLTAIVGKPIDCPQIDNPTVEDVHLYHNLYVESLKRLYDKYKVTYAQDRRSSLSVVG